MRISPSTLAKSILPLTAVLALAACGGEKAEPTYETGVEDLSGGELIVRDADAELIEVELPETEMVKVTEGDEE